MRRSISYLLILVVILSLSGISLAAGAVKST